MSNVNFSRPLIAAAHKGEFAVLIADSVGAAAAAYAMNAGASNLVQAVRGACLTTEKGKARTPAVGTLAGLILDAMDQLLTLAPTSGARKEKDDIRTPAMRQIDADAFGDIRRAVFVAAVQGAADARKVKADARKDAAKAAAPAAAAPAAPAAEKGEREDPAKVNPAEIAPAVALQALGTLTGAQLFALAVQYPALARMVSASLSMPAATDAAPAAAAAAAAAETIGKAKGKGKGKAKDSAPAAAALPDAAPAAAALPDAAPAALPDAAPAAAAEMTPA